jgi:hypothetical protein
VSKKSYTSPPVFFQLNYTFVSLSIISSLVLIIYNLNSDRKDYTTQEISGREWERAVGSQKKELQAVYLGGGDPKEILQAREFQEII